MSHKTVQGVYAAILSPRSPDESIDEPTLAGLVNFLLSRNISSFAINGATGEFCLTTPMHLRTLLCIARKNAPHARIVCGIGAAGTATTVELARIAAGEGAQAVLLSMPYFFPYEQCDLVAFVESVAASITLPILLYNLPDFTSPLKAETSCRLIRELPNVIGIKDSGRSLGTLRMLTRERIPACRIVGNDSLLADALREQVCDGVVSGVACVLPELISALFAERGHPDGDRFRQLSELLDTFRNQLSRFPTPWGLKSIAEAREIGPASFSQPLAEARRVQGRQFMAWYREWEEKLFAIVNSAERLQNSA